VRCERAKPEGLAYLEAKATGAVERMMAKAI
jgi:hypothetical protein